jgi:hypothetical protein
MQLNMLTVIETREFIDWYPTVWSDAERDAFIAWISENPEAGDVIPQTTGLRKVRFSCLTICGQNFCVC